MKKWKKLIIQERLRKGTGLSSEEMAYMLEMLRVKEEKDKIERVRLAEIARIAAEKQVALEQEAASNEKEMLEKIEKVIKKPGRPKKEVTPQEAKVNDQA